VEHLGVTGVHVGYGSPLAGDTVFASESSTPRKNVASYAKILSNKTYSNKTRSTKTFAACSRRAAGAVVPSLWICR
jgi:hypothetical protein